MENEFAFGFVIGSIGSFDQVIEVLLSIGFCIPLYLMEFLLDSTDIV